MTPSKAKTKSTAPYAVPAGRVLLLRTCGVDGSSYGGFRWPTKAGGKAVAPDWRVDAKCGNGLHGLLWGEGSGSYLSSAEDALWMVVEADAGSVVDLRGKVKVPEGTVVLAGRREDAVAFMQAAAPGRAVVFGTATAGDCGTATAGDCGTATAGYRGTATAGYRGTATAGDCGTATAGYRGTATAGDCGTATAGDRGTATAGDGGTIMIRRWNGKRYRWTVGEVGESTDGTGSVLKPNTAYRLDGDSAFVEVAA